MGRAVAAAGIGGSLALLVGLAEWGYHQGHPRAPGPSGVIATLAAAVVLVAGSVVFIGIYLYDREKQAHREAMHRVLSKSE